MEIRDESPSPSRQQNKPRLGKGGIVQLLFADVFNNIQAKATQCVVLFVG